MKTLFAAVNILGASLKVKYEIITVDNPQHSDLSTLRFVLLSSHLQDLKEITQDVLYEKYRTECLSKEAGNEDSILREQENK